MFKLSMSLLLAFLISVFPVWGYAKKKIKPPSDEIIRRVYLDNPQTIYRMVKKLYVVERAAPVVILPDQTWIINMKGDLQLDYRGPGWLRIGYNPYELKYQFKLQPQIKYGFKPQRSYVKWIVGGICVSFGVGFGLGFGLAWWLRNK